MKGTKVYDVRTSTVEVFGHVEMEQVFYNIRGKHMSVFTKQIISLSTKLALQLNDSV